MKEAKLVQPVRDGLSNLVKKNTSSKNTSRLAKCSETLVAYKSTSDNSSSQNFKGGSLTKYLENVFKNGLPDHKVKAGRPRHEFDTSRPVIEQFYQGFSDDLQLLVENNYSQKRSDTFRNTIFSYLKKLPIKLREKSCSVSEPKSNKFEIFLDAFLAPFVTCFLQYFDNVEQVPKLELFLYFICICYPEDK